MFLLQDFKVNNNHKISESFGLEGTSSLTLVHKTVPFLCCGSTCCKTNSGMFRCFRRPRLRRTMRNGKRKIQKRRTKRSPVTCYRQMSPSLSQDFHPKLSQNLRRPGHTEDISLYLMSNEILIGEVS